MPHNRAQYLPTPRQIRRMCLRIQATWTDDERRRRQLLVPHYGKKRYDQPTPSCKREYKCHCELPFVFEGSVPNFDPEPFG